ncbi:Zinc finger protein zas1 [Cytospora mali]|uniref:Zinc finger protein zas1 n=1 Tax=Cytospora mali TaxID=578113 RepID=A0A194W8M1_CYTMA|nr:Zinc finger protein zas1 [Valsa mali]
MSSLQSIMNVDEDQHDASISTLMDKKDKDAATPASGFRSQNPSSSFTPSGHVTRSDQQPSSTYTTPPTTVIAEDSNIARSDQRPTDEGPDSSSAVQKGKRRAEISDPRPRTSTVNTSTALSQPGGSRRQSTTSVDSMDQHGYGSASSSSLGGAGGGGLPPNHPTRPMGSPNPEVPIRLTPITGRVSRAKKGVPVHTCDMCNPPKTFTRAEHLSDQEGDKASRSGGDEDGRGSTASGTSINLDSGIRISGNVPPPPGFHPTPSGYGGPSTPSSTSEMPPTTPNLGGTPFQQGNSPAPGSTGPSPQMRDRFGPSPGPGSSSTLENNCYQVQPGLPVLNNPGSISSSPEPTTFPHLDFVTPRTMPPLIIATQNLSPSATLSIDNPPELVPNTEYSPWTSASESNYSTPPSRPRYWSDQRSQGSLDWQTNAGMFSAFPTGPQREIHDTNGNIEAVTASHYATPHFTMSHHLAPAPYQAYGPLIDTSTLMTSFADEHAHQSLLDPSIAAHHTVHHRSSSVRSPTPPPTSAQAADTLVTPAPISNRIDPMAQVSRQKELVMGGGGISNNVAMLGGDGSSPSWASNSPGGILTGSGLAGVGGCGINGMTVTPLPRSVRNAVPGYLEVYWDRFHPFYPLVHPQSVEGAGDDVLKCAMAAMGTQYINSKEDRIRGNQLHEYAWQEAKRCPPWDLHAMQAIILCEYFARFRGRKAVVRPSKLFESLYSRVLDHQPTMYTAALGHSNMELQSTNEERWHTWLEAETRRRLLTFCFILDNHASMYQQQPPARNDIDPSIITLTGPSSPLWEAKSADEWAAVLADNPAAGNVQYLPHPNTLTPEEVTGHSYLDQIVILHAETLRLPRRRYSRSAADKNDELDNFSTDELRTPTTASFGQNFRGTKPEDCIVHLFSKADTKISADAYLALHYTPLHDLLAVSGDSYVFCQKVLLAPTYLEQQKRLRAWAEGRTATTTSPTSPTGGSGGGLDSPLSAVKATVHAARALVGFLDRGADASNGVTPYVTCISEYWAMYGGAMGEDEAVAWLRLVSEASQPEQVARMRGRREASAGVVSMVKRRLEADCVGPRSQLYVDAVGVLKKLEEGVNRRWF